MLAVRDYLTVEKIGYEDGVYFTMEVYKLSDGGFRCHGYAMASGVKITDWDYFAIDMEDAYTEQTRDYLVRELRPLAKQQLEHLGRIALRWGIPH